MWAPPGPPRLEQTRLFAGTLLSWETVDDQGARIRDFTGAEDTLRPLLTPRAVRGLLRLGARVDPRRKGARASLEHLLSCWELPAHEAALDFEERLGGLRFANVQWGPFGIVGASGPSVSQPFWSCLLSWCPILSMNRCLLSGPCRLVLLPRKTLPFAVFFTWKMPASGLVSLYCRFRSARESMAGALF